MAAEAEAAREARAKAIQVICFSLEVFFFFLLVHLVCFFLFFFVHLQPQYAIFFKLESTGKGDLGHLFLPRSFSFVSPARFFFPLFCYFQSLSFSFCLLFLPVSATLSFVSSSMFFLFFLFLSIYLYLRHHHLFKLEGPGKRRSRSQVRDNR